MFADEGVRNQDYGAPGGRSGTSSPDEEGTAGGPVAAQAEASSFRGRVSYQSSLAARHDM